MSATHSPTHDYDRPLSVDYAAFATSCIWITAWFYGIGADILLDPNALAPAMMQRNLISAAVLLIPIALVWTTADYLRRAQQLRQASEALVQSVRLLRPQDAAADGVTSIVRALRSEIELLVGVVERAVHRARELEGIVHKEIAAIEQHDRTIATLNRMLAGTATGFQQTAQDMRITAQQVVKDVESVRSDLKRATLDLTDDDVGAMCRVAADPKAALDNLTDVMRRHFASIGREDSSRQSEGAKFAALKARMFGLKNSEEPTVKPKLRQLS